MRNLKAHRLREWAARREQPLKNKGERAKIVCNQRKREEK